MEESYASGLSDLSLLVTSNEHLTTGFYYLYYIIYRIFKFLLFIIIYLLNFNKLHFLTTF